ncbi:MAG TPA: coenzyme F390 synthetase [Methanomicrobiales archaeon]|nr:coenzyme F390 synthetase [Methanomicrobiales archaeon]
MPSSGYYSGTIETADRETLNGIIDERVRYTVRYAYENSPFYRSWFDGHGIDPSGVKTHEDLLGLPVISGNTIRANQPPETKDFLFRSVGWDTVFTVHETSGTSGTPKAFFLTWQDWERYAEKYARIFISQGFGRGDRVVICFPYGRNVGANTMTLAARGIGMTVIPQGTCRSPGRILESYHPTGMVGSVFRFLALARELSSAGIRPSESGVARLVAGGESFAPESRAYVEEIWGCPVHNTYGSTEGTMCGECEQHLGLHVPEDLVHLDIYDPGLSSFVPDGECGRIILSTLIGKGEQCGTLLLNYDTEDSATVISRERCPCGRTHMRIMNPTRDAETFRAGGAFFNRIDVERGVFQRENMEYLSGEYESFLISRGREGGTVLQVSVEVLDPARIDREGIRDRFIRGFIGKNPYLRRAHDEGSLTFDLTFAGPGSLEIFRLSGRPRRLVDRRR